MRIIYFTDDYTPHDHRFLSALARTNHRVFLLRLRSVIPKSRIGRFRLASSKCRGRVEDNHSAGAMCRS